MASSLNICEYCINSDAKFVCPKCKANNGSTSSFFCSRVCFKKAWREHKKKHQGYSEKSMNAVASSFAKRVAKQQQEVPLSRLEKKINKMKVKQLRRFIKSHGLSCEDCASDKSKLQERALSAASGTCGGNPKDKKWVQIPGFQIPSFLPGDKVVIKDGELSGVKATVKAVVVNPHAVQESRGAAARTKRNMIQIVCKPKGRPKGTRVAVSASSLRMRQGPKSDDDVKEARYQNCRVLSPQINKALFGDASMEAALEEQANHLAAHDTPMVMVVGGDDLPGKGAFGTLTKKHKAWDAIGKQPGMAYTYKAVEKVGLPAELVLIIGELPMKHVQGLLNTVAYSLMREYGKKMPASGTITILAGRADGMQHMPPKEAFLRLVPLDREKVVLPRFMREDPRLPVVQILVPDTKNRYPGDEGYTLTQPLLNSWPDCLADLGICSPGQKEDGSWRVHSEWFDPIFG